MSKLVDYKEFLDRVPPFSESFTLDAMKKLMTLLGNPQDKLNLIHIAGTNGKGSSTMMLSYIYNACGYSVSTYTSPYISDYRECIQHNNQLISIDHMNQATSIVEEAYTQMIKNQDILPTKYECLTAIAFVSMNLQKSDICVIETLMGGIDDATNVISAPLCSLITSISLDHTEYLGNTLELITEKKAGIIKINCPVIINQNPTTVINILTSYANKLQADIHLSTELSLGIKDFTVYKDSLILKGNHQHINLQGVLQVIHTLKTKYPCLESDILSGLTKVKHPCRIETYHNQDDLYIFDGGHNQEGIDALYDYLNTLINDVNISDNTVNDIDVNKVNASDDTVNNIDVNIMFIFGMLNDKDYMYAIDKLYPLSDLFIVTEAHNPRSLPLTDTKLVQLASTHKNILLIRDIYEAFDTAVNKKTTKNIIVSCGSLYTAYPLRQYYISDTTRSPLM